VGRGGAAEHAALGSGDQHPRTAQAGAVGASPHAPHQRSGRLQDDLPLGRLSGEQHALRYGLRVGRRGQQQVAAGRRGQVVRAIPVGARRGHGASVTLAVGEQAHPGIGDRSPGRL
jgi:hypothetical protein